MKKKKFMLHALKLAEKGRRNVQPNPLVGAVLVKNNKIIGEGYHGKFGGPHAEEKAIRKAGKKAKGATLFVTLEPCSTWGKRPPCTDIILKSGIKKVIVGSLDPNPKHRNKSKKLFKENNIQFESGLLSKKVEEQNESFFKFMKQRRPFVSLKLAMSLDGKIGTVSGDSKWISSEESRRLTHELRAEHGAVMVGSATALGDQPKLNVRNIKGKWREPLKVVLDSNLSLPLSAPLFRLNYPGDVILFTKKTKSPKRSQKRKKLEQKGVRVFDVGVNSGKLSLKTILNKLSSLGVSSLLVEGGGKLAGDFFDKKLVDKIYFFKAPIILGGEKAVTSVQGRGFRSVKNAVKVRKVMVKKIDRDYLFVGYPQFGRKA